MRKSGEKLTEASLSEHPKALNLILDALMKLGLKSEAEALKQESRNLEQASAAQSSLLFPAFEAPETASVDEKMPRL